MRYLFDFWLARDRHEELLREAARGRLVGESRRAREARGGAPPKGGGRAGAAGRTEVRRGLAKDAPQIADLLQLRGMPRWVALEERFIVAERGGKIVGVVRFREEPDRLYLGLLVTGPRVEEGPLAARLYAGARTVARELGVGRILAGTRRHGAHHLARAGYREGREGWRTDAGSG